jgi:dTDP-4-dehydrorhamnose reductase
VKVLVLGHKGMLGHMVAMYLRSKDIEVVTINTRWPMSQQEILSFDGNFIINCIGAIPQRTNKFDINWELPIWLDKYSPCKIIHPGTDCEMDNDDYGLSKKRAADYICESANKTKILKTSIIGPELNSNASLLEWFLSQEDQVYGYTKAIWNGNTTLEWSKQCFKLINNWDTYKILTILEGEQISKYDMLSNIKEIFNIDIDIIPKNT